MTPRVRVSAVMCYVLKIVLFTAVIGQAGSLPVLGDDKAKRDRVERDEAMRVMRALASRWHIFVIDDDDTKSEAAVFANPLLRYTDPARYNAHADGAVWAWGQSGRPTAICKLMCNDFRKGPWFIAFSSTSTQFVEGQRDGQRKWTPQLPGLHFSTLDGKAPSNKSGVRKRQIKTLSRRFSAHEIWDNMGNSDDERYELRQLTRPIHQYRDSESGILDGALFAFTHSTNPQIVLLIEATSGENGPFWNYALVRLGSAEYHVELDGREVWSQPKAFAVAGRAIDTYWIATETELPAPMK